MTTINEVTTSTVTQTVLNFLMISRVCAGLGVIVWACVMLTLRPDALGYVWGLAIGAALMGVQGVMDLLSSRLGIGGGKDNIVLDGVQAIGFIDPSKGEEDGKYEEKPNSLSC